MSLFTNEDTTSVCFRKTPLYKSLPFKHKVAYHRLRLHAKWIWSKYLWSNGKRFQAITYMLK